MSNFYQSDKVVCIDDSPGMGTINGDYYYPNGFIKRGTIYVVEEVKVMDFTGVSNSVQLVIVGVPAIPMRGRYMGEDAGLGFRRFRKLSEIQAENAAKQQAKAYGQEGL